jgi:hypothetical protein
MPFDRQVTGILRPMTAGRSSSEQSLNESAQPAKAGRRMNAPNRQEHSITE